MNVLESKTVSILVVDDDPKICEFLSSILEKEDFQVVSTFRSSETLGLLKKGSYIKFSLVITDLQMPGMGGYSIIKDIQAEDYDRVPVLVITGRNLDNSTTDMISQEPNVKGLCKKPLAITDFLGKVYDILGMIKSGPSFEQPV